MKTNFSVVLKTFIQMFLSSMFVLLIGLDVKGVFRWAESVCNSIFVILLIKALV